MRILSIGLVVVGGALLVYAGVMWATEYRLPVWAAISGGVVTAIGIGAGWRWRG